MKTNEVPKLEEIKSQLQGTQRERENKNSYVKWKLHLNKKRERKKVKTDSYKYSTSNDKRIFCSPERCTRSPQKSYIKSRITYPLGPPVHKRPI